MRLKMFANAARCKHPVPSRHRLSSRQSISKQCLKPSIPGFLFIRRVYSLGLCVEGLLPEPPEEAPINRRHVPMNKFRAPDCDDYNKVAEKIREVVRKIGKETQLENADAWIRQPLYSRPAEN